jgi:hypothetical protein
VTLQRSPELDGAAIATSYAGSAANPVVGRAPAAAEVGRPGCPNPWAKKPPYSRLGRIIVDPDVSAGLPPLAEEECEDEDAQARSVCHRKPLAEPEPQPRRVSVREERALLRALLNQPPYDRD